MRIVFGFLNWLCKFECNIYLCYLLNYIPSSIMNSTCQNTSQKSEEDGSQLKSEDRESGTHTPHRITTVSSTGNSDHVKTLPGIDTSDINSPLAKQNKSSTGDGKIPVRDSTKPTSRQGRGRPRHKPKLPSDSKCNDASDLARSQESLRDISPIESSLERSECNKSDKNTVSDSQATRGASKRVSRRKDAAAEQDSRKITDYFQIRRSSRMTGTQLKKQELADMENCIRTNKHDGLEITEFELKGRGVTATRKFKKGEFVVEYVGELIDLSKAKQREEKYSGNRKVGCYMYYFQHKDKSYCVDATEETEYLGRLVNHSQKNFNCVTKVVDVDGVPHLILVASRDIREEEEILYDYGDRSKESLEAYPWLAS